MSPDAFPGVQDNSGFNLEACVLQRGMIQATGQPMSAFSPLTAAAGLACAVARAEAAGDGELNPLTMPF